MPHLAMPALWWDFLCGCLQKAQLIEGRDTALSWSHLEEGLPGLALQM